jgi:pSer/pThr/pTyr-binding forkhead associated (FHA) protein
MQTAMSPLAFVERRPMAGRVIPLEPGQTIGREGCDVILPDPEVSRRHARLGGEASLPAIDDLGSLNGTFVNDRRIDATTALRAGDVVRLGNTVWVVELLDRAGADEHQHQGPEQKPVADEDAH